jgi:hypothetical protein
MCVLCVCMCFCDVCVNKKQLVLQLYVSMKKSDHLCGLVARVLGYRSGGTGSIPALPEKKVVGLERGPLSLVSTTEELLDRKVAAPVYKTREYGRKDPSR